ncbi:MAG: C4-dicarboxylate ABC transporter permease [Nitratireductor sp.]|nr:TRAP transporter small permease subunit [Nitratireductor sp. B36]MAS12116.1 C4-dicarboxylate ABC transporter permease [Nitratireductor sp.]MCC5780505.1 TRAP transporter small permease subunit [Nitratireductor sp. B36]
MIRQVAGELSEKLNRCVEIILIALMAALVVNVWIGVADRYYFHWQFNWPEPLARYLMIWTVLLAISSGIVRREHIGLTILIDRLPVSLRRTALLLSDLLGILLFAYLFWFGLGFAAAGLTRQAMILGLSLGPAYSAIPAAAGLAAIQLLLVMLRDLGEQRVEDQAEL